MELFTANVKKILKQILQINITCLKCQLAGGRPVGFVPKELNWKLLGTTSASQLLVIRIGCGPLTFRLQVQCANQLAILPPVSCLCSCLHSWKKTIYVCLNFSQVGEGEQCSPFPFPLLSSVCLWV